MLPEIEYKSLHHKGHEHRCSSSVSVLNLFFSRKWDRQKDSQAKCLFRWSFYYLTLLYPYSDDIILSGSPEDCLRTFRKFSHKVVGAAEWQVWLNRHPADGFPVMFKRKRPLGAVGGGCEGTGDREAAVWATLNFNLGSSLKSCLKKTLFCAKQSSKKMDGFPPSEHLPEQLACLS